MIALFDDLILERCGDRYQLRQGHALLGRLLNSHGAVKVPVQGGEAAMVIRTRRGFYVATEHRLFLIELNDDVAIQ